MKKIENVNLYDFNGGGCGRLRLVLGGILFASSFATGPVGFIGGGALWISGAVANNNC
jgi:hypothetical protein